MRWELSAVRWEELGRRPAMITLSYPGGDWLTWAPNGPAIRKHIERFKLRWRRRWGEPLRGVWVREFQERGAPHFHMYVGLPEAMSDDEYAALTRRTVKRKVLEKEVGKYEARRSAGYLNACGDFSRWVLRAWSESVGTERKSSHARFGVDVATFFWSERVARDAAEGRVNWGRVADYLWRESGKWGQKQVPERFDSPGRAWGRWGVSLMVSEADLTKDEFYEYRRVVLALYAKKAAAPGTKARRGHRRRRPRGADGLTLYAVETAEAQRAMAYSARLAIWKREVWEIGQQPEGWAARPRWLRATLYRASDDGIAS